MTGKHGSLGSPSALLENMRLDQSVAVTGGWHTDASNIQQAMMMLLESTSGPNADGMTAEVVSRIRHVSQRLYRWHRNRGNDERAQSYRLYVENIASNMVS